jgi:hypothetical protein
MSYLSTADINAYLWTSWEDTLIATLNKSAEIIFNNLIWSDWLSSWDVTEKFSYPTIADNNWFFIGHILYLKNINPTVIKEVDWVAVTSWEYEITWQKVFLKNALSFQSAFPYKNSILYTAWFSTIPDDVKQAIYMIVGALYNTRTSQWLDNFRQDLLAVTYSKTWTLESIIDPNSFSLLSSIVNKYKVPLILSSWADRTIY